MSRFRTLTNEQWALIKDELPGREGTSGKSGRDNRLFLDAVLWILRTGAPWRDLPARYGKWNTVYVRFRRWAEAGVFERIFDLVSIGEDCRELSLDGTIVKVHQDGTGALKKINYTFRSE